MTSFKDKSRFKKTTEYIYKTASKRIKERKFLLNLTDSKIAGDYDRKIISRIINNTRSRNNVYLIPPAYVSLLVRELGFDNDMQLFWGNVEDDIFVQDMFCNLLLDVLDKWDGNADIAKSVLIDDVAYAKIAAHKEEYIGDYNHPDYNDDWDDYIYLLSIDYMNNGEQFTRSERETALHGAILRLYKNTRPIKMFKDFFEERNINGELKGFSKLEKRLDEFVDKKLIPFMKDNIPGKDSLGLRIYTIIQADISDCIELEYIHAGLAEEYEDFHYDPEYYKTLDLLMAAGKDYVNKIEEIQLKFDELHRKIKYNH